MTYSFKNIRRLVISLKIHLSFIFIRSSLFLMQFRLKVQLPSSLGLIASEANATYNIHWQGVQNFAINPDDDRACAQYAAAQFRIED